MPLSITNKLIQYLKNNKDVFEVLFFGISNESFIVEPKLYFKNYHELIYQTKWLFENWCDNNKPTGILHDDSIVFMEEDGIMVEYCKGLQNLPYVLLSIRTRDTDYSFKIYSDLVLNEYGNTYNFFLNQYETWCRENNIVIHPKTGENFVNDGMGISREINPFYIPESLLLFDETESSIPITVKTLGLIN